MSTTKRVELKKFYLDNKLMCNCVVLAILFFINCFWGDMAYISFSVVALMILFADTKEGFSTLVVTIPYFCIKMNISMVLFGVCAVIFLAKAHIKIYFIEKKKMGKKTLILFLIFLAYCLLPFGPYRVGFWVNFVATFGLLGLINVFTEKPETLRLKLNLNLLAMSLLVASVYCLTYFVSPYMEESLVTLDAGDGFIRFAALFDNTLNLSRICEICIALQIYFIISHKHSFTWVDTISMIIYIILGVSTISKATLIIFAIMGVILVCYVFKHYPFKTLLVLTGLAFLVLIAVFALKDFVILYAKRFIGGEDGFSSDSLQDKIDTITTGRLGLWMEYLSYIFEHPLVLFFGAGFGAYRVAVLNPHSFYISMLYELGIVGSALFVSVFVIFLINYIKKHPVKISKAIWVPLAILLLVMCVEDYFICIY